MGKPPRSWVIGVVLFGLALAACGGTSVEVFCESVVEAEASISNGPGDDAQHGRARSRKP